MSYEFAVFISYSRQGQWPQWVGEFFLPIFKHYLQEEVDPPAEVFIDKEMREGHDWRIDLKDKLTASKVLVPLWSPSYFRSKWCLNELALMAAREKKAGFGTKANSRRLILPAVIHGRSFPREASRIQSRDLSKFANIRTAKGGVTEERLADEVRAWVPSVNEAIQAAPPFDPAWTDLNPEETSKLFQSTTKAQKRQPQL